MAACQKIRIKKRKYCIGDLRDRITLYNRAIIAPVSSSVDFDETFTPNIVVRAGIETKNGVTIFDDSNIERVVTHDIVIRYISGITQETWVDLNSQRLDVITVENLDERNKWLKLRCTNRGKNTVKTNFA